MSRRQRRLVAVVMMMGVLFAQLVTTSHACALSLVFTRAPASMIRLPMVGMPADCGAIDQRGAPMGKVCESHCAYGKQVDAQPDVPLPALAARPPLMVRLAELTADSRSTLPPIDARSTAPPFSLRFGRFLI